MEPGAREKMKRMYLIILFELGLFLTIAVIFNQSFFWDAKVDESYHVTMNRIVQQISDGVPLEEIQYEDSEITRVFLVEPSDGTLMYECTDGISYWMITDDDGEIEKIVGFEYHTNQNYRDPRFLMNCCICGMAIFITAILVYLQHNLVIPFYRLQEIPEKLAKGRIELTVHERKPKYFGKFLWGLGMLRDTMKSEQDKAMELRKERHTLLTSISHGIKTPVTNIMLYADSIQSGLIQGDKTKVVARNISENAQKIHLLVKELLDTSGNYGSELNVELKRFYLKDWFQELKDIYQEKLKLLMIPSQMQYEKNLMVVSDENALMICVGNLIENAIKYGDGKRIDIMAEIEEDMLLLRVRNTGEAIPKHELPHIYSSFWRGSNALEREGNGLGLYICRTYARKLGGEIEAECRDGVTEFILAVPVDSTKYLI